MLPVKIDASEVRTPSPILGMHTEEVLRGLLELTSEEIATLRAADVIR